MELNIKIGEKVYLMPTGDENSELPRKAIGLVVEDIGIFNAVLEESTLKNGKIYLLLGVYGWIPLSHVVRDLPNESQAYGNDCTSGRCEG